MNKLLSVLLLCLVSIVLVACGSDKTSNENDVADEARKGTEQVTTRLSLPTEGQNFEEPSSILIVSDDGPVVGQIGSLSWSYTKDGETKLTEREAVAPHEIATDNAKDLTASDQLAIQFDFDPISYDVIVWDKNRNNTTYGGLASIEERGTYIVEILAHFEQGTASYTFAFNLK